MKTRFFISILSTVLCMLTLCTLYACNHATNKPPIQYEVWYLSNNDDRGSIEGPSIQYINPGEDCYTIIAVPNENYIFTGWSDGLKTPERTDTNIRANLTFTAYFEPVSFSVEYLTQPGGKIIGSAQQTVPYLSETESVEAIAEDGFMFIGWSDGETSPSRSDFIQQQLSVTALFERLHKLYTYDYNYATSNDTEKKIDLHIDNLSETKLIVPQKDHSIFGGWFADKKRTIPIADENGNLLKGRDIFDLDTDTFYAKWTPTENLNFKMLFTFVNEVCADFPLIDGSIHSVNYKLSPLEREICELIPSQIERLLNETFYGYVTFEVDSLWIERPLGIENFEHSFYTDPKTNKTEYAYSLNEYFTPEIAAKTNGYDYIMCAYHLNDPMHYLFPVGPSGMSSSSFGNIFIDTVLKGIKLNYNLKDLLNTENHQAWYALYSIYLHEFSHAAETQFNDIENYHNVLLKLSSRSLNELEITKLFLLNQAIIDGKTVGVPHDFWTHNYRTRIHYFADYNQGTLKAESKTSSSITLGTTYGGSVSTITAIPHEGFRFVKWSDGVTTPQRTDTNITLQDWDIWAIFEKIE